MTDPNLLSPDQNTVDNQVSPEQLSLLENSEPVINAQEEESTRLDISHIEAKAATQALMTEVTATESSVPETTAVDTATPLENNDQVSTGAKAKIIAAFAIVLIAGYVAYWVQEPLQIKADVIADTASQTQTEATQTEDVAAATDAVSDTITEPMNENSSDSASVVSTEDTSPAQPAGQSVNVDVSLFGFEPATLKIDKATTVIWTNTSTEDQTIIGSSPDGQSFVSPVLTSGDTFNYLFEQDGTFEYYSTYNPALKATIMVGLGSDVAVTTTSDTDSPVTPETTDQEIVNVLETAIDETSAQDSDTVVTAADPAEETVQEELKPAAESPKKLTKTGPAETLYAGILLTIAWFNRKKLQKAFRSNK